VIVVTGGAGFIGSGMLARLNQAGRRDILVVDELDHPLKRANLKGKRYLKLIGIAPFLKAVQNDALKGKIEAVIHLGACSSTTETDAAYLMANNTGYSIQLCQWAMQKGARFIYASSAATYGGGEQGYSDDPKKIPLLKPLNLYGWSKQLFDLWVLGQGLEKKVLGLKFFNVFGPNEGHKGEMRSLVDKAYLQVVKTGAIRLFKSGRKGIRDGESTRDFIYVKDACELMFIALKRPSLSGILNLGTGRARNWNDLASAVFSAMGREAKIEYIPMPDVLKGKYQYHTQAETRRLFKLAGRFKFTPLEDAVADYVGNYLIPGRQW
jgi:ADP-L-glycero-D-manno-heptose 6-epimerase